MFKSNQTINQILALGLVLMLAGGLFYPSPAQARLDELIRPDAPYQEAPETEVGATAEPRMYIVRSGDTLGVIAQRHHTTEEKLVALNQIGNRHHILAGQVLMVPGGTLPYVVQPGDNLNLIAHRFGVTAPVLAEMNNLQDPNHLTVGQRINIPAGEGGVESEVSRGTPLGELGWPVVGWISSPFGLRNGKMHHGLDIAADHGQPVRAVRDGRVIFTGVRGEYGNTVILDHGQGLRTLYGHNSALLVKPGQRVQQGEPIARVGSTGYSTGPHVHLEVIQNGVHLDPLPCLKRQESN